MTDAPERIATWCWNGKTNAGQWSNNLTDHYTPTVEYVRADLVASMKAENERLRSALRECEDALALHGEMYPAMVKGYTLDALNAARAALRSTEASHDD